MAIKSFKPYSAGRRFMTVSAFDEITASKPEKSLLAKISQKVVVTILVNDSSSPRWRSQTSIPYY